MIYLYIYITVFLGTFVAAVYKNHQKVKKIPGGEYSSFLGIKLKEALWKTIIFSAIVAPIVPFLLLYTWIDKAYYRNRPRPIREKWRKYLKKDLVADSDGSHISIARYNRMHHTNFTLEQVYGRRYVAAITLEEREQFETEGGEIHIVDNLPDNIYTKVSKACADGMLKNNWDAFAQYMNEDTIVLDYGNSQNAGGLAAFKSLVQAIYNRYEDDILDLHVQTCEYVSRPCVVIKHRIFKSMEYILFRIVDDHVTHIIHTPPTRDVGVDYDPLQDLPMRPQYFDKRCGGLVSPLQFHLPCMVCGAPSEKLQWRKLELSNLCYVIAGVASMCPHCFRQAEYYVKTQTEILQNQDENEDSPF